jgi:hypothetical protein
MAEQLLMGSVSDDLPLIGSGDLTRDASSLSEPRLGAGVNAIVEVTTQLLQADLPRDYITNTLHFNTTSPATAPADWQALVDAIGGVWTSTVGPHWSYTQNKITVTAYNQADAKPRPEKAIHVYTPGTWQGAVAYPRQIAMVVAFYCGRNLKRLRGRVYLTPGINSSVSERPNATALTNAMGLLVAVNAATNAATPIWSQTVWSDVLGDFNVVSNYWTNDVWDTQRRRSPKETSRQTHP